MKNKKLIAIIAALAAFTLIIGYLNMKSMDAAADEEGTITFASGGNAVKLSFDEITSLNSKEFKATEDTSSSGPRSSKYKGILLKDVLNKVSVSDEMIKAASKVIIKGSDGYAIALAANELLSDKSLYLAFEKNGKPLGNRKSGGSGPFQLIALSDSFSQRWCKYVSEVSLE